MDGDGAGNGADDDINGDGQHNGEDEDMDGDGGNNGEDNDIDGDGINNANDSDPGGGCSSGNPCCNSTDPCCNNVNPCNPECYDATQCCIETEQCCIPTRQANECTQPTCSLTLSSATGQPCEIVYLTLTSSCQPLCCNGMRVNPSVQYPSSFGLPPWMEMLNTPRRVGCDNGIQQVEIRILPHAPPGPVTVTLTGTPPNGTTACSASATVTVQRGEYDVVNLEYNAFIAPEVVYVGTIAAMAINPFHKGDGRWFGGPSSQSRSHQTINVSLNPTAMFPVTPKYPGVAKVFGVFGTSNTYTDSPLGSDVVVGGACQASACSNPEITYDDWCLVAGATPACTMTAVPGIGSNILHATAWRSASDPTKALVHIYEVGYNLCATGSFAIDVSLLLEFRQVCEGATLRPLEFRIAYGVHDGFPWHEFFMTRNNGLKIPIYQHNPCKTGEGAYSLGGIGEHGFHVVDNEHPLLLGPQAPALNYWQPVP